MKIMNQNDQAQDVLRTAKLNTYVSILANLFKEGVDGERKFLTIPEGKDVNPYRVVTTDDYSVRLVTDGMGVIWIPASNDRAGYAQGAQAALQAVGIKVLIGTVAGCSAVRFVKQDRTNGYISITLPLFKMLM